MPESPLVEIDDDLDRPLWGVEAIRRVTRDRTVRQTYHRLETGVYPASKAGRIWVSTRRRLESVWNGARGPSGPAALIKQPETVI
jgi:hypothetical protein